MRQGGARELHGRRWLATDVPPPISHKAVRFPREEGVDERQLESAAIRSEPPHPWGLRSISTDDPMKLYFFLPREPSWDLEPEGGPLHDGGTSHGCYHHR